MREAMLPPKLRDWRAKLSAKAKQEKRYRFYSPAPASRLRDQPSGDAARGLG